MICRSVLFLFALACSLAVAQEPTPANRLRVVTLQGSPYARGFEHGKQLQPEIQSLIKLWKKDLRSRFQTDPDSFIKSFFERSQYRKVMERWTPDLLQEIKGIAEGSGAAYETIFVFQLVDEYWSRGKIAGEHCSSVGLNPRGHSPTVLAQNLDLEPFRDRFQTLLRIRDENELESFVVTFPGFIGACGLNSRGVGVVPNTLDQLNSCDDGLPVAFIIRGLLQQTNLAAAERFLKEVKHASGQNYMLGAVEGIKDFECSANKVVSYSRGDVIWHTNHSMNNDDHTSQWAELLRDSPGIFERGSSAVRFQSIQKRVLRSSPSSVEDVKGILQSKDSSQHPICRSNSGSSGFRFASVLMVFTSSPELHIAAGPPDVNAYQSFRFTQQGR